MQKVQVAVDRKGHLTISPYSFSLNCSLRSPKSFAADKRVNHNTTFTSKKDKHLCLPRANGQAVPAKELVGSAHQDMRCINAPYRLGTPAF